MRRIGRGFVVQGALPDCRRFVNESWMLRQPGNKFEIADGHAADAEWAAQDLDDGWCIQRIGGDGDVCGGNQRVVGLSKKLFA